MTSLPLLDAQAMAGFVARGFLRLDAVVPDDINAAFLAEMGTIAPPVAGKSLMWAYFEMMANAGVPEVAAGTPLAAAYPPGSALARLLDLPVLAGAVRSLVGIDPVFDHHFLHVTFPPAYHAASGGENVSQHLHQDSTIDPRRAFDIQIMYYPHDVTRDMGGTRFLPGSHLRQVSEAAIARYQNIRGQQHMVCKAGTLLFIHSGIWHGGGVNHADRTRTMFKIRINPGGSQVRQFDVATLVPQTAQRPIFYRKTLPPHSIEQILMTPEPWFENDTGRLEFLNRIKLWRYLTGDPTYDADYWLTRIENRAGA
ncbi:MAG: phytanoyl-CoA dioxygenase family protein [Polymorphobacter sp.]